MTDIVRDLYGNPLNRDATITTLRAEVERLKRSRDRYRMAWEEERRRFTEARAAITQEKPND